AQLVAGDADVTNEADSESVAEGHLAPKLGGELALERSAQKRPAHPLDDGQRGERQTQHRKRDARATRKSGEPHELAEASGEPYGESEFRSLAQRSCRRRQGLARGGESWSPSAGPPQGMGDIPLGDRLR